MTMNSEGGIYALFAPAELAYSKLPGMRSYKRAEEIQEADEIAEAEEKPRRSRKLGLEEIKEAEEI